MTELEDMAPFEHRGVTYYADGNEYVYDANGKLLGYICSRGAQYGWGALVGTVEDQHEFARGNGIWEPSTAGGDDDPAMQSILEAHAHLCGVCQGRGKVRTAIGSPSLQTDCPYCTEGLV